MIEANGSFGQIGVLHAALWGETADGFWELSWFLHHKQLQLLNVLFLSIKYESLPVDLAL